MLSHVRRFTNLVPFFALVPLALGGCDGSVPPDQDIEKVEQALSQSLPNVDNMAAAMASDGANAVAYVWPVSGADGKSDLWSRLWFTNGTPATAAIKIFDGTNDVQQPDIVFANGAFWVFFAEKDPGGGQSLIRSVALNPSSGAVLRSDVVFSSPTKSLEPKAAYDSARNEILVVFSYDGRLLAGRYLTPSSTGALNTRSFIAHNATGNIQPGGHDVAFSNGRYGIVWSRMGTGEDIFFGSIASGQTSSILDAARTWIALGDAPAITAANGKFAIAVADETSNTSRIKFALVSASCSTGGCSVTTQSTPLLTLSATRSLRVGVSPVGDKFQVTFPKVRNANVSSNPSVSNELSYLLADGNATCVLNSGACERSIITDVPGSLDDTYQDVFITNSSVDSAMINGAPTAWLASRSNRIFPRSGNSTRLVVETSARDSSGTIKLSTSIQSL
jgi:hypothetical protein